MISPTACGALFSARTTPTSRNPGGTLVEPSWNLTSGPPRTTPEPIWAETPKLSAVGEKTRTMIFSKWKMTNFELEGGPRTNSFSTFPKELVSLTGPVSTPLNSCDRGKSKGCGTKIGTCCPGKLEPRTKPAVQFLVFHCDPGPGNSPPAALSPSEAPDISPAPAPNGSPRPAVFAGGAV